MSALGTSILRSSMCTQCRAQSSTMHKDPVAMKVAIEQVPHFTPTQACKKRRSCGRCTLPKGQ
eukprot:6410039-Amphidinium_carterae.1